MSCSECRYPNVICEINVLAPDILPPTHRTEVICDVLLQLFYLPLSRLWRHLSCPSPDILSPTVTAPKTSVMSSQLFVVAFLCFSMQPFPPESSFPIHHASEYVAKIVWFLLLEKIAQPVLWYIYFAKYWCIGTRHYLGYVQYLALTFHVGHLISLNLICIVPLLHNHTQLWRICRFTPSVSESVHFVLVKSCSCC